MILAVNIGNTNIRAAIGQKYAVSDDVLFSDEFSEGGDFIRFFERSFGGWDQVEDSIVSSVVPEKTEVIMESIMKMTGKMPQRVDVGSYEGLSVRRYNGLLGEDRVVCCAGALIKYSPPIIVIDFGTAATVNVISEDREFLGGAILAGVKTSLKALSDNTAQLPLPDIDVHIPVIGQNTKENLLSGAVIGLSLAVEGYIRLIGRELGVCPPVIVTGGYAPVVLPYCGFANIHEPNLLLDGLFALYKNIKR